MPPGPKLSDLLADSLADGGWRTRLRTNQLAPDGQWRIWLLLAGRGFGKTLAGANWVHELAQSGKYGRIALVAPTTADLRDTMVEGSSGILATAPSWSRPLYEPSKRRLTWPNGAIATTFTAEESERLRGPNHDAAWCDELCAWDNIQGVWDQLQFTLRIGRHPRICVTTTPRPIPLLKQLIARVGQDVVLVRGSTLDNAENLSPSALETYRARYEGTRLGRQELHAEVLEDVVGALWQRAWIDATRVANAPQLGRIVVAVDPAVSTSEGSDETGIVVVGIGVDGRFYVLADLSGRYNPDEWARRTIGAYHRFEADRIVIEANQGGDMVANVIRSVDKSVPLRMVHASRGKVTRAEPISALYEQGRVSHVGAGLSAVEDQMCSFTSDFDRRTSGYSPDRVDALVWALTELARLGQVQQNYKFVPVPFCDGNGVWTQPAKSQEQTGAARSNAWKPPASWTRAGQPREAWQDYFVGPDSKKVWWGPA